MGALYAAVEKPQTRQWLGQLPPGTDGIKTTLRFMREFVEHYKTYPQIRELALQLTASLPQKDFRGEVEALFSYVQNHIRYVKDIHGVETVQTPLKTLEYGAGDCDDKTTLLATLLESLGHPTRFHAMGFRPGHISHVILETLINQEWVPMDPTEPVNMGWKPPKIKHSIYRGPL